MGQIILLVIIGLAAGLLGGMMGVGGGVVIVPAMLIFFGMSQHTAQGTSTATLLFPIGILAAYNYYKQDAVNWRFAIIIALGFIIGSFLGSKFALTLDAKTLKRVFAVFLFFIAGKMMWDSFKTTPT